MYSIFLSHVYAEFFYASNKMYTYSYDIRFYIEFFFLSLSQLYIESELMFFSKERNRKKESIILWNKSIVLNSFIVWVIAIINVKNFVALINVTDANIIATTFYDHFE